MRENLNCIAGEALCEEIQLFFLNSCIALRAIG